MPYHPLGCGDTQSHRATLERPGMQPQRPARHQRLLPLHRWQCQNRGADGERSRCDEASRTSRAGCISSGSLQVRGPSPLRDAAEWARNCSIVGGGRWCRCPVLVFSEVDARVSTAAVCLWGCRGWWWGAPAVPPLTKVGASVDWRSRACGERAV